MKVVGLIVGFLVYLPAFGNTLSEKRAEEMVTILESAEVRNLLQQENGVGSIEGISFVPSVTEISNYEIQFSSHVGFGMKTCSVPVDISDGRVNVGDVKCNSNETAAPTPEKPCSNPSPIGCLDR